MSLRFRSHRLHFALLPALALLSLTALTGCEPETGGPTPANSATAPGPSASASAPSPTGTGTASATPSAGPHAPLGRSCDQLISAQTMYNYNSNFVAVSASAASGSGAAAALAAGGVACAWQNTTSSETIVLGAARYSAADLASLKTASSGTSVSNWGDDGVFSRSGNRGTASFAFGTAWITLASPVFFAATDADPLVQSVVTALR